MHIHDPTHKTGWFGVTFYYVHSPFPLSDFFNVVYMLSWKCVTRIHWNISKCGVKDIHYYIYLLEVLVCSLREGSWVQTPWACTSKVSPSWATWGHSWRAHGLGQPCRSPSCLCSQSSGVNVCCLPHSVFPCGLQWLFVCLKMVILCLLCQSHL